jgi:hypothetical protein
MKRVIFIILISFSISVSVVVCRKEAEIDTSLFTTEVIGGVRYVHNHGPQLGEIPGARFELIGIIGKLEGDKEQDILYDPVDAARLSNGDILILERDGCSVKRYNKAHEYISSFGQRG